MKQNTTAILLATYNGARYLREQIESLYAQTFTGWTLYVHDDGSTDGTQAILAEYARMKDNFVVLDYPGQHGAKANFLSLLRMVEARYYFFADQDDVWLPDKMERCMRQMLHTEQENVEKHADSAVLVCCDVCVVDERLQEMSPSLWKQAGTHPEFLNTFAAGAATPFVTGCTMLINRQARETVLWKQAGKATMHDAFITLCVLKAGGKVVPLYQPLMYYRQHGTNTLGAYRKEEDNIRHKFSHLHAVVKRNAEWWAMLRALNYGSLFKFLKYKYIYKQKCRKAKCS